MAFFKPIPELAGLSREEARRKYQEAYQIARKRPGVGKAIVVVVLMACVSIIVFGITGGLFGFAWMAPLGAAIGGGIGASYYAKVIQEKVSEVLREKGNGQRSH